MKRYIKNIKKIYIKRKKIIENVFKTNFKRNVLISYIIDPFYLNSNFSHTNTIECMEICKIFSSLYYNVDVVSYFENIDNFNFEKYEILFGFGNLYEKSFYSTNSEKLIRIFYGTGTSQNFSNNASLNRMLEVYNKKQILIPESTRLINTNWPLQQLCSDYMIILGNEFTKSTYQNVNITKVYNLPASFHKIFDIELKRKNFNIAKKNFLFFGSSGLIHRGLDLLLEVFTKRKDIFLHICGPISKEIRFKNTYNYELFHSQNIYCHDFIDIRSNLFKDLMYNCGFVIYPSASEGGCASIVTVLGNGGLVPIISRASGLDIFEFGIDFEKISSQEIENKINIALDFDIITIDNKSNLCYNYINNFHSFESFKNNMSRLIKLCLD